METNRISFIKTKKKFEEYLLSIGYSKVTVASYQRTLSQLEEFMSKVGETVYSTETGAAFIKKAEKSGQSKCAMQVQRLAIRRLDDFVKGKYSLKTSAGHSVPDCFLKDFNAYMAYLRFVGRRESTIQKMYYQCFLFLMNLHQAHIDSLSAIKPQDIYGVFSKSSNKIALCVTLRSFLRYLFKSGILVNDLSVFVPSVKRRQPVLIQKRKPSDCSQA